MVSNPICENLHILLNHYFEEVGITTSNGEKVKITPKDQVSSHRTVVEWRDY